VCEAHPAVLSRHSSLIAKLNASPALVHAAAARSCLQQVFPDADHRGWAPTGVSLEVDFSKGLQPPEAQSDVDSLTLADRVSCALRRLPQQPDVVLILSAPEQGTIDDGLSATERFLDATGDQSIASVGLCSAHGCTGGRSGWAAHNRAVVPALPEHATFPRHHTSQAC
jgi:hypothetical protein